MIKALIFDLDGTLVQTETLKAISYARAAVDLGKGHFSDADVIEAFKEVVGLPRQEVARALLERFQIEEAAAAKMSEFDVLSGIIAAGGPSCPMLAYNFRATPSAPDLTAVRGLRGLRAISAHP